jgi:hypothetical protein
MYKPQAGAGRWSLHVGETSFDPDIRFDQHETGYKASRDVNRFGLRQLPQLFEHFRMSAKRQQRTHLDGSGMQSRVFCLSTLGLSDRFHGVICQTNLNLDRRSAQT